jgi:hypothetical protein
LIFDWQELRQSEWWIDGLMDREFDEGPGGRPSDKDETNVATTKGEEGGDPD